MPNVQALKRLEKSIQETIEGVLEGLTDKEQRILLKRLRGEEKLLEAGGEGNCDPFPKRIRAVNLYLAGMQSAEETPPDEIHVMNPGGVSPIVYKLDEVRFAQAKAQLARDRGMLKDRSARLRFNRKRRAKS